MKLTTLKSPLQRLPARLGTVLAGDERLRGGAATKRRREFLYRNPLCAACTAEGQVSATTVPDHRVPLWAGGADDLDHNGNPLCREHHDSKSACEARMRAAGGWLATPCICGQHEA